MIKKKKIDESLSLSGRIRNIILCFMEALYYLLLQV